MTLIWRMSTEMCPGDPGQRAAKPPATALTHRPNGCMRILSPPPPPQPMVQEKSDQPTECTLDDIHASSAKCQQRTFTHWGVSRVEADFLAHLLGCRRAAPTPLQALKLPDLPDRISISEFCTRKEGGGQVGADRLP